MKPTLLVFMILAVILEENRGLKLIKVLHNECLILVFCASQNKSFLNWDIMVILTKLGKYPHGAD